MCRLTAIITRGDPILLADILTRPRRSIIQQSFNCQERLPQTDIRSAYQKASLNGDGFGVGWYTKRAEHTDSVTSLSRLHDSSGRQSSGGRPDDCTSSVSNSDDPYEDDGGACVFTSLKPAWADRNLYNLAEKISSRLFFAHVRAASSTLGIPHCSGCDGGLPPWAVANGSVSTELCCHPFRCGRFLFMHNGSVGGFNRIRRDLLSLLPDPMFSFAITSSCIDSACLFAIFLALLPNKPTEPSTPSAMKSAVEQMISTICWLLEKEKIEEITLINVVVSDGECIVATRFVTNAQEVAYESGKSVTVPIPAGETAPAMPASLYFATGTAWQQEEETFGEFRMTHRDKRTDICIVTSEPLTSNPEDWMPVPRNTMIVITPSIDLLLYPIASVGYLPPLLWNHCRPLSLELPEGGGHSAFDKPLSVRNVRRTLGMSLAGVLERDFSSFVEIISCTPTSGKISEELPLRMLRSLERIVLELASEEEINGESGTTKALHELEHKLRDLGKRLRTAHAEQHAVAALEDIRLVNTNCPPVQSAEIPPAAFHNEDFGFESTGGTPQCYELVAGTCAILCLETIMVCIEEAPQRRDIQESVSPALPVAAKTFVFAGMQSGAVVIYDATSASVAPVSFQAHVGGVLAMAVYASPWTSGSTSTGRVVACEECGSALPEVFLVTGGSDTSLALWDLSPLLFGGREPQLLTGKSILVDGPQVSISPDDLLAARLTFLPHQGDVLSLLVADSSSDSGPSNGFRQDPVTRVCTVEACKSCLPSMRAAMRLEGAAGRNDVDRVASPLTSFSGTDFTKAQSLQSVNENGSNLLIFIGFQSAKIGAVMMNDLIRYFRHTQVMVSVLANAVSFQPAQQQALPLRVSRDFELKKLASGQVRVMFSSEQERESLRSLFTKSASTAASVTTAIGPIDPQSLTPPSVSSCQSPGLASDESFRSLLAEFARSLRSITLHASHSMATLWPGKWCRSGRPGCLYPPTGTVYCFEAPHELEVPLPEGAAASASPGTYRVITSTSSLKIVAQPSKENGGLKIEMRFLPFEQSGMQRQCSHKSLVGPWLDDSGHNGFVECLICCGKKIVCSGGGDGRLLLWGEGGTLVGELSGHHGGVLCVAYTEVPFDSPCRDLRPPVDEKPENDLWSREGSPRPSEDGLECLQGLLFSGSRDSSIRVWALEQLVCTQTLSAHTSEVLALAADASRNILISGSANGELFVWQLDLMVVVLRLSLNTSPLQFGEGLFCGMDGRRILRSGSREGKNEGVSFTDILLIADFSSLHTSGVGSVDTSPRANGGLPTGLQLWAARGDGKLGVWSLNETDFIDDCTFNEAEDVEPAMGAFEAQEAEADESTKVASAAVVTCPSASDAPNGEEEIFKKVNAQLSQPNLPEGRQLATCKLPSKRLGGMIVSPGASMPSLPSLRPSLKSRRTDFLPLLAQFVAYKSVSSSRSPPYVSGCIGAAKFVAQLFEQALGANVDIVWPRNSEASSEFYGDNNEEQPHPVVFARLGNNPHHPTIVFYSHYDVVPAECFPGASLYHSPDSGDCPSSPASSGSPKAGSPTSFSTSVRRLSACDINNPLDTAEKNQVRKQVKTSDWHGTGWNTNPWKIRCKDGYIYGRGVTDNKGPIICSLLAVKQFISEWRRKHRGRHAAQRPSDDSAASTTGSQAAVSTKNDLAVPFNFVWICEGDEENGSIGLADAVAQKRTWLQGARFLICNNSYWADDTTPCLVYGMRGVLDIRVEATSGGGGGVHSGLHGGAVEEPMQNLVHLLGRLWDPATGRVMVPHFYDSVQPPDDAELQRVKSAAESIMMRQVTVTPSARNCSAEEVMQKSWLEPSLSLLDINTSFKGKCVCVAGATRIIPLTAVAEISLRLVPKQGPKEIFAFIRKHLEESFKKTSSGGKLTVHCLRQGRPWRADLEAPLTRALYGAAHFAVKEVWGVDPLYVREGGSMPGIPFLADVLRRLPGSVDGLPVSDEVAVCQLPFGQASDNAHLPNERLGIRQVEKGVDVLACTLEALAVRLSGEASAFVAAS